MFFENFRFVKISLEYLEKLYEVDTEVFFDRNSNYENKPHLGILLNNEGMEYVIPLTSAKNKHRKWHNVTDTNYLIYEYINKKAIRDNDIFVFQNKTKVKRILAVLEIKKMIPVKQGLYEEIDIDAIQDVAYKKLLEKEVRFCRSKRQGILERADKIYEEQMTKKFVKPFHCNFETLEAVCKTYVVEKTRNKISEEVAATLEHPVILENLDIGLEQQHSSLNQGIENEVEL